MLAKKNRLLPSVKISKANSINTPYFSLRVSPNKFDKENKFGFIVTKVIDKRAVVRNKIKRRFRSCIEDNLNNIKGESNYLFFIKKEALELNKKDLCKQIILVLKKESIIY